MKSLQLNHVYNNPFDLGRFTQNDFNRVQPFYKRLRVHVYCVSSLQNSLFSLFNRVTSVLC